jgi:hypothetical protein
MRFGHRHPPDSVASELLYLGGLPQEPLAFNNERDFPLCVR